VLPHIKTRWTSIGARDAMAEESFKLSGTILWLQGLFLKAVHEIKQSLFDILRIIINSTLLYNFLRKSHAGCDPYFGNHCAVLSFVTLCTA
jgi:hypothetical protein